MMNLKTSSLVYLCKKCKKPLSLVERFDGDDNYSSYLVCDNCWTQVPANKYMCENPNMRLPINYKNMSDKNKDKMFSMKIPKLIDQFYDVGVENDVISKYNPIQHILITEREVTSDPEHQRFLDKIMNLIVDNETGQKNG